MADSRPKKGLDEMLPDELLIRAKRIANFRSPDWPIEFSPDQVAALMAGGWQGEHKTEYSDAKRLVAEAIRAGRLSVRPVKIQGKSTMTDHVDEFWRRVGTFHIERSRDKTLYRVDRQACADWLNCRGAKPGRYPYIDAWLRVGGVVLNAGPALQADGSDGEQGKNPSFERKDEPAGRCKATTSVAAQGRVTGQEDAEPSQESSVISGHMSAIARLPRTPRKPSTTNGRAFVAEVRKVSRKKKWNTAWSWLGEKADSSATDVGNFKVISQTPECVDYTINGNKSTLKRSTFEVYWSDKKI